MTGTVEQLGACFATAARKTDVKVVMVYLKKGCSGSMRRIYGGERRRGGKSRTRTLVRSATCWRFVIVSVTCSTTTTWPIECMLKGFWTKFIRRAMVYMGANEISRYRSGNKDYKDIVGLALDNMNDARAEFAKAASSENSWRRVFDMMEFNKWLDKKQTEEFIP